MSARKTAALFLIIWPILLAGCSDTNSPGENNIPDVPDFSGEANSLPADIVGESGGTHFGYTDEWPDYIPEDIPELAGDIRLVMVAPESHIRIFYDYVSERQIEKYLTDLQEVGFQLEYIVYVDERFPDDSEERIRNGEYDAVDITKGEYHMNLSLGNSQPIYDVYTSGFEDAVATATTPQWPDDLNGVVPPPERCALTRVDKMINVDFGYSITCEIEDSQVFEDYINRVEEMGFFKDPHIVSMNESQSLWLTDGAIALRVDQLFSSELNLTIEREQNDTLSLEWPQELEGLVPPPERCEIMSIFPATGIMISCQPEDDNVLQDYLSILRDLGYIEDNIFEGIDGQIISVTMVKMDTSIDLMISPDSITIHVK